MLDVEKSFFFKNWEVLVIFVTIAYFIVQLRDTRKGASKTKPQVNDEETIENDDRDQEIDSGEFAPALENVEHVPFKGAKEVMKGGVQEFFNMVNDRRSIRMFSDKPVDIEIVKKCIHAAGTAPSGAHTEPWTFCLVKR